MLCYNKEERFYMNKTVVRQIKPLKEEYKGIVGNGRK